MVGDDFELESEEIFMKTYDHTHYRQSLPLRLKILVVTFGRAELSGNTQNGMPALFKDCIDCSLESVNHDFGQNSNLKRSQDVAAKK